MTSDRVMPVRAAAATAIQAMAAAEANFLVTTELENVAVMCFKAFEGANYETRKAIARCLGSILAATQQVVRVRFCSLAQTVARKAVGI